MLREAPPGVGIYGEPLAKPEPDWKPHNATPLPPKLYTSFTWETRMQEITAVPPHVAKQDVMMRMTTPSAEQLARETAEARMRVEEERERTQEEEATDDENIPVATTLSHIPHEVVEVAVAASGDPVQVPPLPTPRPPAANALEENRRGREIEFEGARARAGRGDDDTLDVDPLVKEYNIRANRPGVGMRQAVQISQDLAKKMQLRRPDLSGFKPKMPTFRRKKEELSWWKDGEHVPPPAPPAAAILTAPRALATPIPVEPISQDVAIDEVLAPEGAVPEHKPEPTDRRSALAGEALAGIVRGSHTDEEIEGDNDPWSFDADDELTPFNPTPPPTPNAQPTGDPPLGIGTDMLPESYLSSYGIYVRKLRNMVDAYQPPQVHESIEQGKKLLTNPIVMQVVMRGLYDRNAAGQTISSLKIELGSDWEQVVRSLVGDNQLNAAKFLEDNLAQVYRFFRSELDLFPGDEPTNETEQNRREIAQALGIDYQPLPQKNAPPHS